MHPELPTCATCQAWMFDDNWRQVKRAGVPVPRPPGAKTPCWKCPKISPESGREMDDRTWKVYRLYLEVKAGAPMPDDAIVRRNCGLIRFLEDSIARTQQRSMATMLPLLGRGK